MLLAIDTATRTASIALYNADGVLAEATWRSRENHTVELMPQIAQLSALLRAPKNDWQAIAIALGPGSFTGLRVGMSVAKGLAFGCHIPLIGIPTMDAIALPHAWQTLPIWAILSAGRGRFTVARYAPKQGKVKRTSAYALVDAPGLIDLISNDREKMTRAIFCGDVDTTLAQRLREALGENAVIPSPALNVRRAGYVAELAWARFQRGQADAVATLAPLYPPFKL